MRCEHCGSPHLAIHPVKVTLVVPGPLGMTMRFTERWCPFCVVRDVPTHTNLNN